jgi:esterase/lipase superfamily enzyme
MMFLAALLASTMWMISDREQFWNPNALSSQMQVHLVHSDGRIDPQQPQILNLSGKKVLMLIHGYNNNKEDVLSAYFKVKKQIDEIVVEGTEKIYDEVIGYVWPGYASRSEYFLAKEHAAHVSTRVSQLFYVMGMVAKQFDVMAHSMGNLLFLEAMNHPEQAHCVTNFFSLGAAVGDRSIEKGEIYHTAIENCKEVYIVYSKKDDILRYLYTLAEWDRALGSIGIEDIGKISSHVQLVDCSDVVPTHNQYQQATEVYTFLRDRLLGIPPLPEGAKQVKLLPNYQLIAMMPLEINFSDH